VTFPWIHIFYPGLVHPLYYTTFYHIPLLKIISTGFHVPYSHMYRKFINHIHFPLGSSFTHPLAWPVLHPCPSLFKCLLIVRCEFCLGILPVNILCLSQSNSLHYFSSPFPLTLYCSTVFGVFCCVLFLHRWDVFHYYPLSLILFFLP
jgi:hypothetical protein